MNYFSFPNRSFYFHTLQAFVISFKFQGPFYVSMGWINLVEDGNIWIVFVKRQWTSNFLKIRGVP